MADRPSVDTSVLRLEDPDLLTGRARFVDDVKLRGTLAAAFVRSPFAHAAFRNIDTSVARALPGVHAVYTLEDLRPHLTSDRTPLGNRFASLSGFRQRPYARTSRHSSSPVTRSVMLVRRSRSSSRKTARSPRTLHHALKSTTRRLQPSRIAATPPSRRPRPCIAGFEATCWRNTPLHTATAKACSSTANMFSRFLSSSIAVARIPSRGEACSPATTRWKTERPSGASTQSPHEVRLSLVQLFEVDDEKLRVITPDVGAASAPSI